MKGFWLLLIVGVLLILAGSVWALQGFNVLPGSVMTGSSFWAIVGPIVALVGVALVLLAITRRRRADKS